MNTLYHRTILEKLSRLPALELMATALAKGPWPVDVGEFEGGFAAASIACLAGAPGIRAQVAASASGPVFIVVPTDQEAESLVSDLATFGLRAELLSWWKTAAYRPSASRNRIFGERVATLSRLIRRESRLVVASQRAFVTPVPPRSSLIDHVLALESGKTIDPVDLGEKIAAFGYLRVPRVSLPGEFALRGEVLDIFQPGDDEAIRVVFEFDTIERIVSFDPQAQSGHEKVGRAVIRPLKEILWTPERIEVLAAKASNLPGCTNRLAPLLEALSASGEAKGEELWYPLAFPEPGSIIDYLRPEGAEGEPGLLILLDHERLHAQEEATRKEYAGMYRTALKDIPVPPPELSTHSFAALEEAARAASQAAVGRPVLKLLRSFALKDEAARSRIMCGVEAPRSYFGNITYFKEDLASLLNAGYEALVLAESEQQAERIGTLLRDFKVSVGVAGISSGFRASSIKLAVIQEAEIFGRRKRVPKSVRNSRSAVIDSFIELAPGDFVVHINYGIGKFIAIERMRVMGNERDYIKIAYADQENVFVPIEQANLVQRYIGNEGDEPRLDRLGSKSWEGRKTRVKKAVEELAERLIRIYARRKAAKGHAFPADDDLQLAFEATFPYTETVDQLRCIEEVKADMESERPMDRLICGDVGYGKTEIAMRACFKAAASGKQVALLAPTTILAEQHYENMKERLEGFPLNIAMMSRFVDRREQRRVLAGLKEGKVDIVIGTHRIIQKDMEWKDLGLLVIDEEQRFGVKDKERLKEIKATVDSLTLTATPIPRTLHMSLLKIRDMSVLQTPPINRHPIETVVEEFDPGIVARAIRQEVERGGQVFYLHNRIESLDEIQSFLMGIVPEVLVETAHGQMAGEELEDIMHRFIHGGFHVLVSTTIIENGIDIPNVNTIIIDRADIYGISQLYQLRGRVGRSDRLAYAYLFYPDKRALSEIAMKRLQIISDFTELGSGFKIAMKDLEVRGAGNLLGREQSGDIYAVGFDLYLKLLDEAVARLSDENWTPEEETYLELDYRGFIPDEYISVPTIKMEVYKKIASIFTAQDLESLRAELGDRFGPLPEEAESLLALAEIRVICKKLSIASLKERGGTVTVEFSKVAGLSVERVLRLIRESGGMIKLDPHRPNILIIKTGSIGLREKSEFLRERLASLAG
jgi:transcription-repair coupling factor (superfamily II helicase)